MTYETRFAVEERAYTASSGNDKKQRAARRASVFVDLLLNDELVFAPVIPDGRKRSAGEGSGRTSDKGLTNPPYEFEVDITDQTVRNMRRALADGALCRRV